MGKDMVGANSCLMMVRLMKEHGKTMNPMAEAFISKLTVADTKAHL
jgi:hypothetical protein